MTDITVNEAGRKGAARLKEKYGAVYFKTLSKIGGDALKEKKLKEDPDYYKRIGALGIKARQDKRST